MGLSNRHRSPSDLRRREARAAQRATLRESGQLAQQPKTFRYFANRLNQRRSIFESPAKQQDLNHEICCSSWETAAMKRSGGRLSVMTWCAEEVAKDLIAVGWVKL